MRRRQIGRRALRLQRRAEGDDEDAGEARGGRERRGIHVACARGAVDASGRREHAELASKMHSTTACEMTARNQACFSMTARPAVNRSYINVGSRSSRDNNV
jgi:hypothetical protein